MYADVVPAAASVSALAWNTRPATVLSRSFTAGGGGLAALRGSFSDSDAAGGARGAGSSAAVLSARTRAAAAAAGARAACGFLGRFCGFGLPPGHWVLPAAPVLAVHSWRASLSRFVVVGAADSAEGPCSALTAGGEAVAVEAAAALASVTAMAGRAVPDAVVAVAAAIVVSDATCTNPTDNGRSTFPSNGLHIFA